MKTKFCVYLFLFICVSVKLFSQKCPALYTIGDQFISEEKHRMCFKSETEKSSNNIYYTKYTVLTQGGKETYLMDFIVDYGSNKINISYTNQFNNKLPPREVRFDPQKSLILFKDFKANEQNIRKDENDTILFGINNEEEPYITLYHFQLLDNATVSFKLNDVDDFTRNSHNKIAYLINKIDSVKVPEPCESPVNIKELISEISKYKDSVLKHINNEIENINIGHPLEANESLSKEFSDKLDIVFKNYYKNVFPYQDFDSKIEIVFDCNKEGKIEDYKSIRSINSLQIKWFEDNFLSTVMGQVKSERFNTMKDSKSYPSALDNYSLRFGKKINKINASEKPDQVVDLRKINLQTLNELSAYYISKEVNSPTRFTYTINYKSTVKHETWEWKIDKNDSVTIRPLNSTEEISQALINKFKINVPQKRKTTKYQVKRCDVYMNGNIIGEDLQPE